MYCSQKQGEDFAKFCGLLRIYELYLKFRQETFFPKKLENDAISVKNERAKIEKNVYLESE